MEVREPSYPALLHYLQERGINTALAKPEYKELYFTSNGKPYFAIGFPNMARGYEMRNRSFKDCIALKNISHIRQWGERQEEYLVLKGVTDYLSFLILRMKNYPIMPDPDRQDYVVLNSVSNVPKAMDTPHGYEHIHCLLDSDETGIRACQELRKEFSGCLRGFPDNYRGYRGLNDRLYGKPLSRSAESIKQEPQVQSTKRIMQPPEKRRLKVQGEGLSGRTNIYRRKVPQLIREFLRTALQATLKILQ